MSTISATTSAAFTGTPSITNGEQLGGTGGGETHGHTFTGTAMSFSVAYVDANICVKN